MNFKKLSEKIQSENLSIVRCVVFNGEQIVDREAGCLDNACYQADKLCDLFVGRPYTWVLRRWDRAAQRYDHIASFTRADMQAIAAEAPYANQKGW